MSVYLHRVNQKDIVNQKDSILDIELDIILLDNSVFHGIIKKIKGDKIIALNMIRNKFTFSIQDISEIVYAK